MRRRRYQEVNQPLAAISSFAEASRRHTRYRQQLAERIYHAPDAANGLGDQTAREPAVFIVDDDAGMRESL